MNEHYIAVASDLVSQQMGSGAPCVCPPPPQGCPPPTWRQCWAAAKERLANAFVDMPNVDRFVRAAVAGPGCACEGGPVVGSLEDLFPDPTTLGNGVAVMPNGWKPPKELLTDRAMMRYAISKRCVSEIYSPPTAIAAGATERITVQPSMNCFFSLQRKFVAKDTATFQVDTSVFMTRAFIGDCPIGCQDQENFSDFIDTDDCNWCEMPHEDIGRTPNNTAYRVDVRNPTDASVTVQVGIRGICFKDRSCWSGWRSTSCSVCG